MNKGHNSVSCVMVPLFLPYVRAAPAVGFINLKRTSVLILLLWELGILDYVQLNGAVLDSEACVLLIICEKEFHDRYYFTASFFLHVPLAFLC
jgi:hypothetical protein